MDWIVPTALVANTIVLLGGMVVGGRLLLPTARSLAAHLDRMLSERQPTAKLNSQLERLTGELVATREELARVAERQRFLENLLEKQPPPSATLPPS